MTTNFERHKARFIELGWFSESIDEYREIVRPVYQAALDPRLDGASRDELDEVRRAISQQLYVRNHLHSKVGLRHRSLMQPSYEIDDFLRMLRPKPEFRLQQVIEWRRRRLRRDFEFNFRSRKRKPSDD